MKTYGACRRRVLVDFIDLLFIKNYCFQAKRAYRLNALTIAFVRSDM